MFDEIKRQAAGRWRDILPALTQLTGDELTKGANDHTCPLCNHGRLWPADDAEQTGRVACRSCTSNKPTGDGIATVALFRGVEQGEAAALVGEYLGIRPTGDNVEAAELGIVELVAKDKRMPIEAFMQFNPTATTRGRNKRPVARVAVYNERGETHSYFDFAPGEKGWFARGDGMAGMFLPGRLPQPGETWCLVEGAKDCAALIGLGYVAAGMPTSFLAAKYAKLFEGCDIVIVHDLDKAGQHGAQRTGGNLVGIAASVRIARMPGEIIAKGGDDVRDVLRRPGGADAVREAIASAKPWEPREGEATAKDERPEVLLTLTEGHIADQVVTCLGRLGWASDWIPKPLREAVKVYARAGSLVDAIESEDEANRGQLMIRSIPSCIIRERITQAVQLITEKETSEGVEIVPSRPPKWLIDAVHARGWFGGKIRPLTGVIQSPTLRPDGSIIQVEGYDSATGLIYRPNDRFPPVPIDPTREDATRAIDELLETVRDFPFKEPADSSAWLALVLTLIGRPCIAGCCPMFVVTKNIRGAGGSLMIDGATRIAYGRPAARKTFSRNDEELRKVVTSIAIEGTPSVLFDNLDTQLGGAALDAVLTAETWSDRILGSSRTTGEIPWRTVLMATGNNVAFGSDVARRVLPIRLESPHEAPEDRNDFRHSDLLGWVRDNRPRLAVAALIILRAYFVAGRPKQAGGEWGSFESWSALIRGSLVWAGAADPLPTRVTATANDDARALLAMLITGIEEADPDCQGITTKEIERLTTHRVDETPPCPTLTAAVAEICGDRFNAKRFGRRLRSYVGRTWDGRRIVAETTHGGVARWSVRLADRWFGEFGECSDPQPLHAEVCVSPHDTQRHTQGAEVEPGGSTTYKVTKPPTPTTVVNLRSDTFEDGNGRDVRIDRKTKWGNKFLIGKDGNRAEVIAKFRAWIVQQPELMASIGELRGKRLGCHCSPAACHGDVLAELADRSPTPDPPPPDHRRIPCPRCGKPMQPEAALTFDGYRHYGCTTPGCIGAKQVRERSPEVAQ